MFTRSKSLFVSTVITCLLSLVSISNSQAANSYRVDEDISFTPKKGEAGTVVTIKFIGKHYSKNPIVKIGGVPALKLSVTDQEIQAIVMSGSKSGRVMIDDSISAESFDVSRNPTALVQQGSKLVSTDYSGNALQGNSVALSSDGNTLAVGGYGDSSGSGTAWIYVRSGTTWSQEAKVVGTGSVSGYQTSAVALSSDGNTLAVGLYTDNGLTGATWVFTRSGSTWTQQGSKLVGTGGVSAMDQGFAVSLSDDGNTLAVGGHRDNNYTGAVWIFTRSGGTWTQQGSKLVGTGATGAAAQGYSVSLSSDGNTLAVGGYQNNSNAGATWIFTRSGSTWSQQGSKLVGTGATGAAMQGSGVALSDDGNTLASAGYKDNTNVGATWIFTRSGSTWSQQGSKLVGTGASGGALQGTSIALTSSGNTLVVGGYVDNGYIGATWVFNRSGSTWSQLGSKLVGSGYTGSTVDQGYSVAVSGNSYTVAVGGPGDNTNVGATWVFINNCPNGQWSDNTADCAACTNTPSVGNYWSTNASTPTGCVNNTSCTNTTAGYYWTTHGGGSPTGCTNVSCTNTPAVGKYWSTHGGTSPTGCTNTASCTNNTAGYYWTTHGGGSPTGCTNVSCTNTPAVGKYWSTHGGTSPTGCTNTVSCTNTTIGKYFTTHGGGSPTGCTNANCTNTPSGQYWTSHGGTSSTGCTNTACTNKPSHSHYTGHGGASNSCPWDCDAGYEWNGSACVLACNPNCKVQ